MLMTPSRIVMLIRPLHPENALSGMLSPPVMTTVVKEAGTVPNIYLNSVFSVPLALSPTKGSVMLVRPLQPPNALSPMVVTLLGIVILVRLVQPENALLPIVVTLAGIVMLVRLVQPENA